MHRGCFYRLDLNFQPFALLHADVAEQKARELVADEAHPDAEQAKAERVAEQPAQARRMQVTLISEASAVYFVSPAPRRQPKNTTCEICM